MSKLAYIINLAEKGDASAQNELGISYMARGRHGLEEDEEKDFYWLEHWAAAQGLLSALSALKVNLTSRNVALLSPYNDFNAR
jgi:hypothetical protein